MNMKKPTVSERKVSSWNELHDDLEKLANAGWAFRGQENATWPLESSLTRYLKKFGVPSTGWLAREKDSLHKFKRKAHLLLPRTPEEGETLEWLALMQHHGAPTRLLDFTWSPYVAAFFALEGYCRCCNLGDFFRPGRSELSWFLHICTLKQDVWI